MAADPSQSYPSTHDGTQTELSRTRSIQFAQNTNKPPSLAMASPRRTASPDEVTPIRSSQTTVTRDYQTTNPGTPSSRSTAGTTPAPQQSKSLSTGSRMQESEDTEDLRWYKRLIEKYGAVSLDNKGSVARDHLALERTFLAWLRTSLAFASIGIAITQLFRLNTSLSDHSKAFRTRDTLPFAPLLGQSVPLELIPYLQQLAAAVSSIEKTPNLGPTLLDQLLLLPENEFAQTHAGPTPDLVHEAASPQRVRHLGKPLGATFIGISIMVLLVGFHRYSESQYWIIRGKFPASRGSVALIGLITGALIIASLVVVLVVEPSPLSKT